jgi:CRP/FNR family transcriptional regulator
MILCLAQPGDVLGLSAVLGGEAYEVTAEAASPCRVRQVKLNDFLVFVNRFAEAGVHAAQCLNMDYRQALQNLRRVTLSVSAAEKLAAFLLESANRYAVSRSTESKVDLGLTHEEIGQILDMSRETVSRLFGRFKRQGLITVRGGTVTIRNRKELSRLLGIQSDPRLPHQMT